MASKKAGKGRQKAVVVEIDQPGGPCGFCHRTTNDEVGYGKLYSIGDIYCHYYCALLSCCLVQRGDDDEGLLGFLYRDIVAEIARGKKHRCSFCGRGGATLGCSVKQCKKQFHLPCGRERNAVSQFTGAYKSFCEQHAPKQQIADDVMEQVKRRQLASRRLKSGGSDVVAAGGTDGAEECICVICCESVPGAPLAQTFWPPCCARDMWLHRACLERMTLAAGAHYLKCPLCNEKPRFYRAVLSQGYYVPDRDAAWELENGAFAEQYGRARCSAQVCKCDARAGRDQDDDEGPWDIRLCLLCGGSGVHAGCLPPAPAPATRARYVCAACAPAATDSGEMERLEQVLNAEIEREQAQARRTAAHGPVMPSRMSIRRTKGLREKGPTSKPDVNTQQTQDNTTISRLELNLKSPRQPQANLTPTTQDIESTIPSTNTGDMVSPVKFLLEKLVADNSVLLDSNMAEKLRAQFKKPRPLRVKKEMINAIYNEFLNKTSSSSLLTISPEKSGDSGQNSNSVEQLNESVEKGTVLVDPGTELVEQETQLENVTQLVNQDTELVEQGSKLVEQEPVLVEQEPMLAEQESELVEQEPMLAEQESELVEQVPMLVEQESKLVEQKSNLIQEINESIEQRNELVDLQNDQSIVIPSVEQECDLSIQISIVIEENESVEQGNESVELLNRSVEDQTKTVQDNEPCNQINESVESQSGSVEQGNNSVEQKKTSVEQGNNSVEQGNSTEKCNNGCDGIIKEQEPYHAQNKFFKLFFANNSTIKKDLPISSEIEVTKRSLISISDVTEKFNETNESKDCKTDRVQESIVARKEKDNLGKRDKRLSKRKTKSKNRDKTSKKRYHIENEILNGESKTNTEKSKIDVLEPAFYLRRPRKHKRIIDEKLLEGLDMMALSCVRHFERKYRELCADVEVDGERVVRRIRHKLRKPRSYTERRRIVDGIIKDIRRPSESNGGVQNEKDGPLGTKNTAELNNKDIPLTDNQTPPMETIEILDDSAADIIYIPDEPTANNPDGPTEVLDLDDTTTSTFELPQEFIADYGLSDDDSTVIDAREIRSTPKKSTDNNSFILIEDTPNQPTTIQIDTDSSVEISEQNECVNIVHKFETQQTSYDVSFVPANEGFAQQKRIIDIESFKNTYLSEVGMCGYKHKHENRELVKTLKTAIDFAKEAAKYKEETIERASEKNIIDYKEERVATDMEEKMERILEKKIIDYKEERGAEDKEEKIERTLEKRKIDDKEERGGKKRKLSVKRPKKRDSLQIKLVYDLNQRKENENTINLTIESGDSEVQEERSGRKKKKRKKARSNISIRNKDIKFKIQWKTEKAIKKKNKLKFISSTSYKQPMLSFSGDKEQSLSLTPLKKKRDKKIKSEDLLKQTTIQSFFAVKTPE